MYHIKKYRNFLLIAVSALILSAIYWPFIKTPYFAAFVSWSEDNFILYFTILLLSKVVGILYPPMPGNVLTIGSIPAIGWKVAYLADLLGSILGSSIAYVLGKKYGMKLVGHLFNTEVIERINKVKVVSKNEAELIVVLRLIFGATFVEFVNYAAPLLNIKFKSFMLGTILAHLLLGIPMYYFANNLFEGRNVFISLILAGLGIAIVVKFRKRYFNGKLNGKEKH